MYDRTINNNRMKAHLEPQAPRRRWVGTPDIDTRRGANQPQREV